MTRESSCADVDSEAAEEELRAAQEQRVEAQEADRIESAAAEAEWRDREGRREQDWARCARFESGLASRQLAEHEEALAYAALDDEQERRLEEQENGRRRQRGEQELALLATEASLIERHESKAYHTARELEAASTLCEAVERARLERENCAEQETLQQEDRRREAMSQRLAARSQAAAELADGVEVERVRAARVHRAQLAEEEQRRTGSYAQHEPTLYSSQEDEEDRAWKQHCQRLNEESNLLRQESLRLRAETERIEQAALDSALSKLIERQMNQQALIAERGETDRRRQWLQLQAINTALGSSTQLGRGRDSETVRQVLRTIGLDKAHDEQLRDEQRSRFAALQVRATTAQLHNNI